MSNSVFMFPGNLTLSGDITTTGNFSAGGNVFAAGSSSLGWVGARGRINSPSDGVITLFNVAGSDFTRLQFGGTTNAFPAFGRSSTGLSLILADGSQGGFLQAFQLIAIIAQITPAVGTGISASNNTTLARGVSKLIILKEAFITANPVSEVTIATLPSKTRVVGVVLDTTAAFTLGVNTLTLMCGYNATPNDYIVAHDVKTAVVTKGNADADLGTKLARATAVQGGDMPNWGGTTTLKLRLTSGAGNIGDGVNTLLTTGATVVYIVTEKMP